MRGRLLVTAMLALAVSANAQTTVNITGGKITQLTTLVMNNNLADGANNELHVIGSFSGSGGAGYSNLAVATISRSADNMNYLGANYGSALRVNGNFGGASMTGSRAALDVSMVMQGSTANTGNLRQYYVGINDSADCPYGDNGTAGFTNAAGSCVAFNPSATLGSGAQYWYTLNPVEVDTTMAAGSSAAHTFGVLHVKSGGQGTYDDAMEAFVGSAPKYVFEIGKTDGEPSTGPETIILGCVTNTQGSPKPCQGAAGIDFADGWSWAANAKPFASPGFSVDGLGDVTAASYRTTGAIGVSCRGAPTANFVVSAGIVVQC